MRAWLAPHTPLVGALAAIVVSDRGERRVLSEWCFVSLTARGFVYL